MDRRNARRCKSPGADYPVQIDHGCTNNSFLDKEKLYVAFPCDLAGDNH